MTVQVQTVKQAQLAMAFGHPADNLVLDCPLYLSATVKFALDHSVAATIWVQDFD